MEHQFRRGIYRPNAQRLSISLAPLVAQRSLLFRVKADLAGMQTSYGELTPTEDSPGLFALSATVSAKIISAALSAMSDASVWSQDSWQGDASPFGPILAHVPVDNADTRRHAIAFSPSVQWEAMAEETESDHDLESDEGVDAGTEEDGDSDRDSESVVKTPLHSASSVDASMIVFAKEVPCNSAEIPSITVEAPNAKLEPTGRASLDFKFPMKLQDLEGGPAAGKLRKKQKGATAEDKEKEKDNNNNSSNSTMNKRLSRPAKAFGKVMSHLSLQPSSRKEAKDAKEAALRRQTALTVAEYKLPALRAGLSPMRMSFIANSSSSDSPLPDLLALPAPAPSQPASTSTTSTASALSREQQQPPRSTTPPPLPALAPARKGHRRYNSSPAVSQFAMNLKTWETEEMPPLPLSLPQRPKLPTIPAIPALQNRASMPVHRHARSRSTSVTTTTTTTTTRSSWDAERATIPPVPRLPTIPGTPAPTTQRHGRSRSTSHAITTWDAENARMPPLPLPGSVSFPHTRLPTIPATPAPPQTPSGRARSRSFSTSTTLSGPVNIRAISHPFPVRAM